MEQELPYTFDLLWDIKTKSQLVSMYLEHRTALAEIEEVCRDHKIDINAVINELKKETHGT